MNISIRFILLLVISILSANSHGQDQIAQGKILFETWCSPCHIPSGKVGWNSATEFLERKYNGAVSGSILERTNLTTEYVKYMLRNQTPGMAAFRPTELSDADVDALAVYLTRNN
jgi:mono/diheme cytochrome c family protein